MTDKDYIVFASVYSDLDTALEDLAALKEIKHEGEIRDLTAAVVTKDDQGRIKVHESTHAGKVAGGVGLVGGAIIGAIFPPAGLAVIGGAIVDGVVVGAVAGAIGHFAGGISRKDLKELGAMLDTGEAAIVAVAVDAVATDVDSALDKSIDKASAKLDSGDVDAAIDELAKGLDKAANIAGSE